MIGSFKTTLFRRWMLPLVVGVCLGLLAWVYLSRSPSLIKLDRSALELREGRWFYRGQSNLFTGLLVEDYTNGFPKLRAPIVDGLPSGWSEGWHTNGQMQVREFFHAGVADGLRTKWYLSGTKMSEAEIRSGKLHGKFRRWHEDGSLAEEMDIVDGQPDGVAYAFHPSGYVKAIAHLKHGELIERQEYADGALEREEGVQLSAAGN